GGSPWKCCKRILISPWRNVRQCRVSRKIAYGVAMGRPEAFADGSADRAKLPGADSESPAFRSGRAGGCAGKVRVLFCMRSFFVSVLLSACCATFALGETPAPASQTPQEANPLTP